MKFLEAWYSNRQLPRTAQPERLRMGPPTLRMRPGVETFPPSGVSASPPRSGEQIEIAARDASGKSPLGLTFGPNIAAGAEKLFTVTTEPKDYLDLQIVGFKVVAWLDGPLLGVDPLNPYAAPNVAIVDPRAQATIEIRSATVSGSADMVPDTQIMDVGGPFGRSSERTFDGLRFQDIMLSNGKVTLQGAVVPAFPLPDKLKATYDVALLVSVLAVVLRDFRLDPPRRYWDYWRPS